MLIPFDAKDHLSTLLAGTNEFLRREGAEPGDSPTGALDWFSRFAQGSGSIPFTPEASSASELALRLARWFREISRVLESGRPSISPDEGPEPLRAV